MPDVHEQYECWNCGKPYELEPNEGICPKCGKKFPSMVDEMLQDQRVNQLNTIKYHDEESE